MSGYNAAIASDPKQTASPYTKTAARYISQSELVQDIARELSISATQRHQSGLIGEATIVADAEVKSPSSEKVFNIKDLFPTELPKPQVARYAVSVLQEWEGYVVSISENTFTGRLVDITKVDITKGGFDEEEADFSLDDLEDVDRSRIRAGAIFRWTIYYRRGSGGTKERSSRIVFRNLPAWTRKEIERNRRDATEWASALREE